MRKSCKKKSNANAESTLPAYLGVYGPKVIIKIRLRKGVLIHGKTGKYLNEQVEHVLARFDCA
jgi:hypothetical protein